MKHRKYHRLLALVLLICTFSLVFSFPSEAATFNLALTKKTMTVGSSTTLKVPGVKNSKITWKSSAPAVVSITKAGKIKAKKIGAATITGKYKGITFKCKVTVLSKNLNKLLYSKNGISIKLTRITSETAFLTVSNKTKKDYDFTVDFIVLGNKKYSISIVDTIPYGTNVVFKATPWDEKITNPNAKTFSAKLELKESDENNYDNAIQIRTSTIKIK